jgi:hypothetical protein
VNNPLPSPVQWLRAATENNNMISTNTKIKIVNDSFGYEVCVLRGGELINGERYSSLDEAECAAKFLSVRYSAPIEKTASM